VVTSTERDTTLSSARSSYDPDPEAAAPRWFTSACGQVPASYTTTVGDTRIHYLVWNPSEGPVADRPLLLIHGSAAHAHWWSHIAPLLATNRRVAALDLSGHGDSDHRTSYSIEQWADETLAVAAEIDEGHGVTLLGHSIGGHVAISVTVRSPELIAGTITCETLLRPPEGVCRARDVRGTRRYHPSRLAVTQRFRPLPPQAGTLDFVAARIAAHSVRQWQDGWSWKFDVVRLANSVVTTPLEKLVPKVTRPFALIHSEHGLVTADDVLRFVEIAGHPMPALELPSSGHHPMLDQPLALVTAVRAILASWALEPAATSR
jgi:pimeloyl-ACP methyl ester carboxylesterase